jgi:anti-anti-sigma regulatory factor
MQGSSQTSTVNLSGSLTIEKAAEIKRELAAALSSSSRVSVDISAIEDIDLACLQALYAARAEAKALGKELHLEGTIPQRAAKRLSACGFIRGTPVGAAELEAALVDF